MPLSPLIDNLIDSGKEDTHKRVVDTILDTIIDGVILIDAKGVIGAYNKACIRLFGYQPEEVLGKNVKMLMPEPYRGQHDQYLHNYNTTHERKIIGIGREVSGQRKDGTVFPMELAVGETALRNEHAYVGIIRDLSERKEADKAREQLRQSQKMEALGQLTGGIAHDFNNLLAIILGNLDFISDSLPPDHALQQFVQPATQAALQGSELTRQLLAFGRKQPLQPRSVALTSFLQEFIALVSRTLGERITTITALAPDTWNVYVDPSQLSNALLNLSVNARDAMPEGGKLIFETVNMQLDEHYAISNPGVEPGNYVQLSISDTGFGMTPDILAQVFDPFFTTKEVGKGSGLGLSMVYGFVKQSAGHVKIYSEPGVGTTIRLYLPPANGEAPVQTTEKAPPLPKASARRILVVEDNPEVLKLTAAMVENLGYEVTTASDGDHALELLAQKEFALLLSDVMLPGKLNGPAMAQEALKLQPGLKVLFNSGYAEHAILASGILEEGVNLISKPFRKAQLARKLSEMLDD